MVICRQSLCSWKVTFTVGNYNIIVAVNAVCGISSTINLPSQPDHITLQLKLYI